MKERPEPLVPTACNKVNDGPDTTGTEPSCDDPEMTYSDEPRSKPEGRIMESIRSLVKDFIDYTKKTDF